MKVTVNGEAREVEPGTTIRGLLDAIGAPAAGIAVEVNHEIVRKAEHPARELRDGDAVEVVGLVGGG